MNRLVLAAAAVALLGWVSPVQATPITYTETFTGTGTLNGTLFTDATVTVTLTGDTATVQSGNSPFGTCTPACFMDTGSATVNVSGVGTDTFTDSMLVLDIPQYHAIAIVDSALPGAVLYINDSAFATYDLTTSIGPISGPTGLFVQAFPTTSGSFTLTSVAATATFTATQLPESSVPEPGSLVLLGTGLVMLAVGRFRRRSAPNQPQS